MATIGAAIIALREVLTLGWKVYTLWREAHEKKWVDDGRALSSQITEAKTDEERKALAQSLFSNRA